MTKIISDYTEEFEKWFQNLLLHRTKTCNERDVFRYAKDSLQEAYLQMCAEQDERDTQNGRFR